MIRHDAIVNVITDALSAYIKECCDESFQRGVESGRYEERFDQMEAAEAIAAIMEPQWMPVAELVQDERGVLAGGWDDYGDEFETQFIEANDVCSYPELTHYAELPAALPPKGGKDAK